MDVVNPSYLRVETLTSCACEHARESPNTMLTRPKALSHFRCLSQLNDCSTQFNAYQNPFFGKGQSLVEKPAKMAKLPRLVLEAYGELSLETKTMCKVETTKDIVDGLVDFCNLAFYFV